MNLALRDTDFANLQGIYAFLDVPPLTMQEEQFLLLYFRGMSITAAAKGAGMTWDRGKKLLAQERTVAVLDYMRAQIFEDLTLSVAELNQMLLEAHRKAQTSTEEVNAIQAIARLNMLGGYAPAPVVQARLEAQKEKDKGTDVTPKSVRQLEHMSEDDLMELADFPGLDSLDPTPKERDFMEGELDDDADSESTEGQTLEPDEEGFADASGGFADEDGERSGVDDGLDPDSGTGHVAGQ